jgi:hypothetical protein
VCSRMGTLLTPRFSSRTNSIASPFPVRAKPNKATTITCSGKTRGVYDETRKHFQGTTLRTHGARFAGYAKSILSIPFRSAGAR